MLVISLSAAFMLPDNSERIGDDGMSRISVIIPCYNEENNVQIAYQRVKAQFDSRSEDFEIIFTDNHSEDQTFSNLQKIAMHDDRVRVVRFARNFGFNKALLTGYRLASGDAAIQLDCDLQDPPELFSTFIEHWKQGHDVVVGVRAEREENVLLVSLRRIFYRILNRFSDDNLLLDGGDFRLVDRTILDQLKELHEASPYVRGLISSLSSREVGIPYKRQSRKHDQSKFPLRKLFAFAVDGIVSHSIAPLRLASFVGLVIAAVTVVVAGYYLSRKIFFGSGWPEGWATIVLFLLFGISIQAIFLGIIGEYISRIYLQLKDRPVTVVEQTINFDQLGCEGRLNRISRRIDSRKYRGEDIEKS